MEVIHLHQPNARAVICAADNGGVVHWRRLSVTKKAALDAYERALRLADEWHGKKPLDIPASRLTGITLFGMGELHETTGNWRAAKDAYERSQTFWQEVPDDVLPPNDRATKKDLHGRVLRCERAMTETR